MKKKRKTDILYIYIYMITESSNIYATKKIDKKDVCESEKEGELV